MLQDGGCAPRDPDVARHGYFKAAAGGALARSDHHLYHIYDDMAVTTLSIEQQIEL